MYARMHRMGGDMILAACDDELLGESLEGGGRRIEVTEEFYSGAAVSEEQLAEWMRSAGSMNLIGNRAVGVAVREGYASPDQAFEICGVKYLMVVMM
jgi:hypothetical protein